MKLNSVQICNFRSIKDQTIQFTHNCMILVGKNEAGKSNMLKAVAGGLSKEAYSFSAKDKRKTLTGETLPNKNEYYIKYNFVLKIDEINKILAHILNPLDSIIQKNGSIMSLRQYCEEYLIRIVYIFDIITNQGKLSFADEEKADAPFVLTRPLYVFLDSFSFDGFDYKQNDIINDNTAFGNNIVKEISNTDLFQIMKQRITEYFHNNITGVVYWNYSDTLILPDSIAISTFRSSPSVSIPLRNIFELAEFSNIDQAFNEAKEMDGDYENLLNRVSVIATKKFAEKWPDLKGTRIIVSSDGALIRIKIQEKAKYNFSDRSEGFKRFISILLILSTQVEMGKISDMLIVVDEPDNSLYPTSSRFLRDELIKMSESNLVLYSTHSPFMIDREVINRHLIVSKKDDITYVKETDISMYAQDEVLLNAVGTSIFEFLKTNNLLFEGWSDHCIFQIATSEKNIKYKHLYKNFKEIGTAYVHGVSSFKNITPIVQLSRKNVFIFSDSDNAAKTACDSYKRAKGYQAGNWHTIEDLGGGNDFTVEDYFDDSFLQIGLNEVLGQNKRLIKDKGEKPVMKFLLDLPKEQKEQLKNYYSTNIKISDINSSYFDLLDNLWDKINSFVPDKGE